MQIFKDDKPLDFTEFEKIMPKEASILKGHLDNDWTFVITDSTLSVRHDHFNPVSIDILNEISRHKKLFFKSSPFKEAIAKALGIKGKSDKLSIYDATAGMMSDSCLISAIYESPITISERHPLTAALIINALERIQDTDLASRFQFLYTNASDIKDEFDVIYFDPMYVHKNDKTAPKKEMKIFRELIGADLDEKNVAQQLLSKTKSRLVIKRSKKAPYLLGEPQHSIKTKSTRYDVYLKTVLV